MRCANSRLGTINFDITENKWRLKRIYWACKPIREKDNCLRWLSILFISIFFLISCEPAYYTCYKINLAKDSTRREKQHKEIISILHNLIKAKYKIEKGKDKGTIHWVYSGIYVTFTKSKIFIVFSMAGTSEKPPGVKKLEKKLIERIKSKGIEVKLVVDESTGPP